MMAIHPCNSNAVSDILIKVIHVQFFMLWFSLLLFSVFTVKVIFTDGRE